MIVTAFIEFKNKTISTQASVKKITEAIPSLIKRGEINEFCKYVDPKISTEFKKQI